MIPQKDPVERLGRRNEFVAVLGMEDVLDDLVDRRVVDAA